MSRILALHLPGWSIDLATRRGETLAPPGRTSRPRPHVATGAAPVLLVSATAGRLLVRRGCSVAAARGVREGLTLAEARALLAPEEPEVLPHDADRDDRSLRSLGFWAQRFSPVVALDPPEGLWIDASGMERLYRDEHHLLTTVAANVSELGFSVRCAIAGTPSCARAVARHARHELTVVPRGEEERALGPLPVEALRLDSATVEDLHEIGLTRVGHLLRLPSAELGARFGKDVTRRLRQALGRCPEPLAPLPDVEIPRVERVFDGPVRSLEPLMIATEELLASLVDRLERRRRGLWTLRLTLISSDAEPTVEDVVLSRPSSDPRHLWTLLRPRLERASIGYGVDSITLTAIRTGRLRTHQTSAWVEDTAPRTRSRRGHGSKTGASRTDERLGELLDVLATRLGHARILAPRATETHVPEKAFAPGPRIPALDTRPHVSSYERPSLLYPPRPLVPLPFAPRSPLDPATTAQTAPSPVRTAHGGPPPRFQWAREIHDVVCWSGPERIEVPWWHSPRGDHAETRDYFRVRTRAGRDLWVYLVIGGDRWWVHGEWA